MPVHRLVALRLSEWISCFLEVVPPRSRRSFLELLCGCLISPEGWVTRVLSSISLRCHWTTYNCWIANPCAPKRWLLAALPQRLIVELIDGPATLYQSPGRGHPLRPQS